LRPSGTCIDPGRRRRVYPGHVAQHRPMEPHHVWRRGTELNASSDFTLKGKAADDDRRFGGRLAGEEQRNHHRASSFFTIKKYASNSRTHTPEQKISKIARTVEAFGFTNRILGPRSVCARLYVVRPHQVVGAETALPRRLLPRWRASSKSRR
jgi:hypothetical protein